MFLILLYSLRYHQLHPNYLHTRLKELGKGYDLRVLLVQVDVVGHLVSNLTSNLNYRYVVKTSVLTLKTVKES